MTAFDSPTDPRRAMRLIDALHLEAQADGGAMVIDDRTLTAARVNQAAYVILHALKQPRSEDELAVILAAAANCGADAAAVHVDQLVKQLHEMGWIVPGSD